MPNNEAFIRTALAKIQKDAEYAIQAAGIRMLETAREHTSSKSTKMTQQPKRKPIQTLS